MSTQGHLGPRRLLVVGIGLAMLLGLVGERLYAVQVMQGEQLGLRAHEQRTQWLPLRSSRGLVLDRAGEPLTGARPEWGLAAFPALMTAPVTTAQALHAILPDDPEELAERLGASSAAPPPPLWLSRNLSEEQAVQIQTMGLPGLQVLPLLSPYGPGSLAHHLVGYLNSEGGQGGLQQQLQPWLQGTSQPGIGLVVDGRGRPIPGLTNRGEQTPGQEPYDVRSTIDGNLQQQVETILDHTAAERQADGKGVLRGAALVVDVATGEVLSMASRPDFDPVADPGSRPDDGTHFLLNRAIAAYTPGSIFKVVVAAEALSDGLVHPSDAYMCTGHYDLGDYQPTDDQPWGHGNITFADALAVSCNVTFIHVGYDLLGPERLLAAARRFGLGQVTSLGLPGEQPGQLPVLNLPGAIAQMSFGQGLTVTPVQMAQVMQAVANGGLLVPLHVVQGLRDPQGKNLASPLPRPAPRQVVEPWVADTLQRLLIGVTDPDGKGTGKAAWVTGSGSGGKTGSAEGVMDGQEVTHAWFMGFVPAQKPRYAIVVFLEGGGLGGLNAAPLFREIASVLKP